MLGNGWIGISPVEMLVQRACEPSLHEPNYALHIELAELINTKKANTPREAAMAAVRLVNHRNPHVSVLALSLINSLVQSCGYPFHLQIATKEFLNELVRRFPERPPPFPGPVMQRILEMIHGWKEGICVESRWKEDLGNIRDMHRLLSYKGYRFRDFPRNTAASTSATANLKSAEELESEDREAQSAKLQELIRRGTPRDLAAAQELMKSLAGANPDAKPDYKSQSLRELEKLEQKVVLLNEMLDNIDVQRGERFAAGDAYDQVATILTQARPKIQKWISDAETDDPESLDTFLQMNDHINSTLSRFEAFKKGDYATAANPVPSEISQPAAKTNLIDFDDGLSEAAPGPATSTPADDLASLFVPAQTPNPVPVPSSNGSSSTFSPPNPMFPGAPPPLFSAPTQPNTFFQNPSGFAAPAPVAPTPGIYSPSAAFAVGQQSLANLGGQRPQSAGSLGQSSIGGQIMLPTTPKPNSPPAPANPAQTQQQQAQKKDAFADLVGLF